MKQNAVAASPGANYKSATFDSSREAPVPKQLKFPDDHARQLSGFLLKRRVISSGTDPAPGHRISLCVPCAPKIISSRSHLRFRPFRWLALSGVVLAFLLLRVTPAQAVTINAHAAPIVTNSYEIGPGSLRQALLNARDGDTITFDIPTSDPGYNGKTWTIGLTSGQLAIDKNVTFNGLPASLLIVKRDRHASAYSIIHLDSGRPVAIEDLTSSDGLAHPARLVLLTGGATAILYLSLVLFCRRLWRSTRKRIRFGIHWDADRKPVCAKCDGLLYVLNDYSFQCPSCQVELGARGETGLMISPREALVKIRLNEYW